MTGIQQRQCSLTPIFQQIRAPLQSGHGGSPPNTHYCIIYAEVNKANDVPGARLLAGAQPGEHAEQGANIGEAKDGRTSKIRDSVWAEDYDNGNNRIPVSDGEKKRSADSRGNQASRPAFDEINRGKASRVDSLVKCVTKQGEFNPTGNARGNRKPSDTPAGIDSH